MDIVFKITAAPIAWNVNCGRYRPVVQWLCSNQKLFWFVVFSPRVLVFICTHNHCFKWSPLTPSWCSSLVFPLWSQDTISFCQIHVFMTSSLANFISGDHKNWTAIWQKQSVWSDCVVTAGQGVAGANPEGGSLHLPDAFGQRPAISPILALSVSLCPFRGGWLLWSNGGHAAAKPKTCPGYSYHQDGGGRGNREGWTSWGKVGHSAVSIYPVREPVKKSFGVHTTFSWWINPSYFHNLTVLGQVLPPWTPAVHQSTVPISGPSTVHWWRLISWLRLWTLEGTGRAAWRRPCCRRERGFKTCYRTVTGTNTDTQVMQEVPRAKYTPECKYMWHTQIILIAWL